MVQRCQKKNSVCPIEDLSVWRGDGVFEAIKIHNGYPFGINLHIDRLKNLVTTNYFQD